MSAVRHHDEALATDEAAAGAFFKAKEGSSCLLGRAILPKCAHTLSLKFFGHFIGLRSGFDSLPPLHHNPYFRHIHKAAGPLARILHGDAGTVATGRVA